MALSEEKKSKFSFASLISKAYNNTFSMAVNYAYIPYHSFSNSISGICNFNYKQYFVSKFYGAYEFSKSTAHHTVIDILKTIPTFNRYFTYMSKAKEEHKKLQNISMKERIPSEKNDNCLLLTRQTACLVNLNLANDDQPRELPKNPEFSNIGFERVIISEENADQAQYQNIYDQQLNYYQLPNNDPSSFAGWGESYNLYNVGPPPKLYSELSRIDPNVWSGFATSSNLYPISAVVPPQFRILDDQYIFDAYPEVKE